MRLPRAQVGDREDAADDEADQRHDRQRHVQVEDLLDEALVGVERGVEEDQRKRQGEHRHGGDREWSESFAVHASRG